MSRRPLIIESPDLQTLRQRYAFAALTLVFWVIWFYLWIPVISLLAWLLGLEFFYQHMVVLEGLRGLLDTGVWYALVVVAIGLAFVSWSYFNLLRFRGKDKRRRPPEVPDEEMARFFGIDQADLQHARRARRLVVRYGEDGSIAGIDVEGRPGEEIQGTGYR